MVKKDEPQKIYGGIENIVLKGSVEKSSQDERAEIIYNHPDNNRNIRYIPINYDEIGLQLIEDYKEIPIAEPVMYIEKPLYTTRQSDLERERRNAVNNARTQQKTVKYTPSVNPQTRIDYINKQVKGIGANGFISTQRTNEEFEIGKKTIKPKPEKNYEEVAELFYPNMEVKSQINSNHELQQQEQNISLESKIPEISNVEKTLYPNGTLTDMKPKKLYDLTKHGEQYEKVGNVLYPKTDDPKINELKKAAKDENFQIQKDRTVTQAKNIGGAALILGSSLVPGLGEAKVTIGLAKTFGPIVGKKIAGTVAQGIVKGPIQGAIAGLGEGLINDENLLKSATKGTGIGLAAGLTIGLGVGKVTQKLESEVIKKSADKVNNSNLKRRTLKDDKKKYIKHVKEYYKDYERGIDIENKNLGKIRFMSDAMGETSRQSLDNSKYVIDLSKNIKNAKYIRSEEPIHNHKYEIVKFHRLGSDEVDYLIAENAKGEYYFYKIVDKLKNK